MKRLTKHKRFFLLFGASLIFLPIASLTGATAQYEIIREEPLTPEELMREIEEYGIEEWEAALESVPTEEEYVAGDLLFGEGDEVFFEDIPENTPESSERSFSPDLDSNAGDPHGDPETYAESVEDYWTPERMEKAIPLPIGIEEKSHSPEENGTSPTGEPGMAEGSAPDREKTDLFFERGGMIPSPPDPPENVMPPVPNPKTDSPFPAGSDATIDENHMTTTFLIVIKTLLVFGMFLL